MFRIQLWNDAVEKYVPSLISVVVSIYPILPTNKPKKTYASRKSTTFNLYRCLMMFELKTHGFPWLSMVPARCAVLLVLLSLLLGGRGLLHQELPMRRWRSLENRDPGSGFLRRSSGCQPGFFMVVSYDFRRDIFLGYFFRRLNRDLLRYIPGMFLDGSGGFTLFKSCLLLENPLEMELWGFPAMILRAGIPQRNWPMSYF